MQSCSDKLWNLSMSYRKACDVSRGGYNDKNDTDYILSPFELTCKLDKIYDAVLFDAEL